MKALWIFDPAHGSDVPGKRSPDGRLLEYEWSRNMIFKIRGKAAVANILATCLVDETIEIGLRKRVERYENVVSVNPKIVVSVHLNAAGNGLEWKGARGFEIWTTVGKTVSDSVATVFSNQIKADFPDMPFRQDMLDGDPDKESNFTVLTGKGYSAILIENLFQDNHQDVALLMDNDFQKRLADSYIKSMITVENTL